MNQALLLAAALFFWVTTPGRCGVEPYPEGYVRISPRISYYLVEAGSAQQDEMGLGLAPTLDTSNPLHKGMGRDVIAVLYDERGTLAAPPVYIFQMLPEDYYLQRLGGLVQHHSTQADVEQLIYSGSRKFAAREHGVLVYYTIPVTNPLDGPRGAYPGM